MDLQTKIYLLILLREGRITERQFNDLVYTIEKREETSFTDLDYALDGSFDWSENPEYGNNI